MLSVNDFKNLAERDYTLCLKVEVDFPDEYAVSGAAYHIQQAVEKLLKAILMVYGEQPEFTHNVAKLSEKCKQNNIALPQNLEDIADTLTLWESTSRYDPYVSFSKKKYETAKEVYVKLKEQLEIVLQGFSDGDEETENSPIQGI